jgi:cytochrome c biogenesis protein CcmG/thiol:disulfide interchange protein DsbE
MTRLVTPFLISCLLTMGVPAKDAHGGGKGLMETNGTIRIGQEAPPITTADLKGRDFSLESLRGRPVFIDFGSVLCEACADMVLEMNRLMKKYAATDLQIVMIADGAMSAKLTEDFFKRLQASFTVVRDADWFYFDAYGVTVVPFKVLIDREGKIRNMHLGFDPNLDALMGFNGVLSQ